MRVKSSCVFRGKDFYEPVGMLRNDLENGCRNCNGSHPHSGVLRWENTDADIPRDSLSLAKCDSGA